MYLVLLSCTSKAAGPDGVSFVFLKKLPTQALDKLLELYNFIWSKGKFPKSWGESLILPLLKPGKDRLVPSNYRPISLLNCSGKILEKMVSKRLFWVLENRGLINPFQSGGRFRRSTIDNLVFLEKEAAQGLAKKECTVALLLDGQKAFDMTWRFKIIETLKGFNINALLVQQCNFLHNRSFKVKCNGSFSNSFPLQNRIVQGSSLSLVLFIIFMNDILDIIKVQLRRLLFIDDFLVIARGKVIELLRVKIQKALNNILKWSNQNSLIFSADPKKSACILFSRARNPTFPPLFYNGSELKFVDNIKFLGLYWDTKLNWALHINHTKSRAMAALNVLKMVCNKKYGVRRETLLTFYKSYIMPIFDYGYIVYSFAKDYILKKLNPVYNAGIRIATGALRSSPVTSLYVESGIPPLSFRRSKMMLNYVSKVGSCPSNPIHKKFSILVSAARIIMTL
jgi:Reverse transcriptase (RNA-dependent DNA polymerase).